MGHRATETWGIRIQTWVTSLSGAEMEREVAVGLCPNIDDVRPAENGILDPAWKERNMRELNRITQQPGMMGGKACIRGMRVTVGMIVGQVGAGSSIDEILAEYPYLEREDVMQALRYAAWRAEEREVVLASA